MSEEDCAVVHEATTAPDFVFKGSHCHGLLLILRTPVEQFDREKFTQDDVRLDAKTEFVSCAPRNSDSDYHLHVSWRQRAGEVRINVKFAFGSKELASDEHEPYAEQFIRWIAPFFLDKKVACEVHADFQYPVKDWLARFPLPLKAPMGPADSEAEIDGFSCKLRDQPFGVGRIWLTQEFRYVFLHLIADQHVNVDSFKPRAHILELEEIANRFVKERTEKTQ